ncbi:MAG TPA: sugar phosphate isomerase/epimerase, partial [Candidatus Limnocylindria bacterium]|nr:sugar phosphate isomerase/epimerase [Candidatus Limnocylindria bacterium]
MTRRHFMQSTAGVLAAATLPSAILGAEAGGPDLRGKKIRLGMDNFAVRKLGWKGRELVDYAVSLKLDTLFVTDLPSLGTLEEHGVSELRKYAEDKGLALQVGSWSICPTSLAFKKDWGTAEEHLALGLRLSKAAGSPAFRVVLGTREDRKTPGGIEARIADTVRVLQSQRHLCQDLGVKVAVENHAGDMTATELLTLLDAAGKDFVGVNLDSGNACWTLEDPLQSLENLGPYTVTTSLRDSAVWEYEDGAMVQWTAMGEGQMDLKKYFER